MNLLGEMQSVFSDFQIEAEEFIDTGDRLFAAVKIDGTGAQSGVHVEMRVNHVWTYENQVAKRLQLFNEREQALEVAGVH
jgi:ketosteroid isomerase-like protein